MPSPWLSVPLDEYEGHMQAESVQQLAALSELFKQALLFTRPASVAILGIAGGNGLEHIDVGITMRIIGIDINQEYLNVVEQRFGAMPGLELFYCDVAHESLNVAPVDLLHAALVLEHTGLGKPLDTALSLVAPAGKLSVVLQLPSNTAQAVANTNFASIQNLKDDFALIDVAEFQQLLASQGFRLIHEARRPVAAGKALWLGIFERQERKDCT